MMDERTTQVRNKIMSEMAMLMYLFVAAAFAVKVLLMGKGIRDCVVEYVILILAPLYQYVRARQLKFSLVPAGIRQPATSCQAQSCLRGSGRTGIHPGFLENLENRNLGCQRGGLGGADLCRGIPAHKSGDSKD